MSWMNALKTAFSSGAKELNKEYGRTDDFLKGVCASCALVAYADGDLGVDERKKAMEVITNHSQLSALYQRGQIENALNNALSHAQTATGKQELARQLDAVLGLQGGSTMADDVYLVAVDVANADGNVSDVEKAVLDKVAKRLHVDTSKFDF